MNDPFTPDLSNMSPQDEVRLKNALSGIRDKIDTLTSELISLEKKFNLDPNTNKNCQVAGKKSVEHDSGGHVQNKTVKEITVSDSDSAETSPILTKKWNKFTERDRRKIVAYLIQTKSESDTGVESAVWKGMAKEVKFDKDHTYQSLQTHFRRRILPHLIDYVATEKERQKFYCKRRKFFRRHSAA